jgi:hypothetical protein
MKIYNLTFDQNLISFLDSFKITFHIVPDELRPGKYMIQIKLGNDNIFMDLVQLFNNYKKGLKK